MPGIPQIWYLDIFAGKNNYEAADNGGSAGHKEINRTNLSLEAIKNGLKTEIVKKQLELIRLRNKSKAFSGTVEMRRPASGGNSEGLKMVITGRNVTASAPVPEPAPFLTVLLATGLAAHRRCRHGRLP